VADSVPGIALAVFVVAAVAYPVAMLLSFASVVVRFRRSTGDERLQLKWFVAAAAVVAVTFSLGFFSDTVAASLAASLSLAFLDVAIALAILKYRLYDIDVIIGKTIVYGVLAAFFTIAYLAIVVGIGTAIGSSNNSFLTVLAAATIAVAFNPVRDRAKRIANRLVYGERATPYEVLSEFSSRVGSGYADEDILPRMAEILATGTGASSARVWLRIGDELRPAASWPENGAIPPVAVEDDHLGPFADHEDGVEVRHRGELLGALSVTMPASDPMNPSKERLVDDLATQAGLVLRNVRLIEELRASRRRIVTAQDERAKQLERNLHDGAQQQLVALGVQLNLARRLAERDAPGMAATLDGLQAQTTDALENLRDLARGIYPPLLADQGLVVALDAQARKAALPVEIEGEGVGRYPQEVEVAIYFCCLEALQNVAKYANAASARVQVTGGDGTVTFEVTDDGSGFDPARTPLGTGLQGMRDRLEALGGTFEIDSSPGAGTTVRGTITAATLSDAR
jgi:signal transduction histidine kinase